MNEANDAPLPLETAVEELLRATGLLLRRLRAEANPGGLNWSQTWAMARLAREGPMTTADLARAEGVKPQSMGSTLADLEQEGLIKRRPHPTDGRQVLFELTDQGKATRQRNRLVKREWLAEAMGRLDPAEQQSLASAIALIKRLGES